MLDCEDSTFQLLIDGYGNINEASFDVAGQGRGNTTSGQFSFTVTFSDVAEGIDPFANVLGVLILPTGAFGRELGDAVGLMTLADGVFGFTQVITGDGIEVRSVGDISRTGEREFTWRSKAEGQVNLKNVSEIEPFNVVMLPQGFGKVIEVIALPLIEQGERRIVHSVRHFTFTPRSELRQLQLRHVAVVHRVEGLVVSVDTTSTIQVMSETSTRLRELHK